MTSKTSETTGNTTYYSYDGRFSSLNKKAVQAFEDAKVGDIADMDRNELLFWMHSGLLQSGESELNRRNAQLRAVR